MKLPLNPKIAGSTATNSEITARNTNPGCSLRRSGVYLGVYPGGNGIR